MNNLTVLTDLIRELLRAGDREGVRQHFREIQKQTAKKLLWLAMRTIPDEEDARDVVAQAYLGLYQNLREDKPIGNVHAFLRQLVKRRVADFWRKRTGTDVPASAAADHGTSVTREVTMDAVFWATQGVGDADTGGDTSIEAAEFRLFASQAAPRILRSLRPELREVLIMRHWEGLDTQQTAAMLGLTENQVKKRLQAAMKAARETLRAEMRIL